METTYILSKIAILWLEHLSIFFGGFLLGAIGFYWKSKHYKDERLFTRDDVKAFVDMALGEELIRKRKI